LIGRVHFGARMNAGVTKRLTQPAPILAGSSKGLRAAKRIEQPKVNVVSLSLRDGADEFFESHRRLRGLVVQRRDSLKGFAQSVMWVAAIFALSHDHSFRCGA
jgi:hypothetical protein